MFFCNGITLHYLVDLQRGVTPQSGARSTALPVNPRTSPRPGRSQRAAAAIPKRGELAQHGRSLSPLEDLNTNELLSVVKVGPGSLR